MEITSKPVLKWAAPVHASLDIERTISYYCSRLGFSRVYSDQGVWGIVSRDNVYIHFWACSEKHIAENTSCRVYVTGVDGLYAELQRHGVVHPYAPLQDKPSGAREFGVVDEDGNLVTFAERMDVA